jgi:hypothetical protein
VSSWGDKFRQALTGTRSVTRTIRGVRVTVINRRPEIDTEQVFVRVDATLALIETHVPWHFRRLRRDFSAIVVERFPCRGAFFPETRTCLFELTFSVNPSFSDAQRAASILHEAMHARLHAAGVRLGADEKAREERFCRRAEVEFGTLVPDGGPVIARALESLAMADDEVAPEIDWDVARRRMVQADVEARIPRDSRGDRDSR